VEEEILCSSTRRVGIFQELNRLKGGLGRRSKKSYGGRFLRKGSSNFRKKRKLRSVQSKFGKDRMGRRMGRKEEED